MGASVLVLILTVTAGVFLRRKTLRTAGRDTAVQMPELFALGKFLVLLVGGVGGLLAYIWLAENEGMFVGRPVVVQVVRVAFIGVFAWGVSLLGGSMNRDLQAAGLMEQKAQERLVFKMRYALVVVLAVYSHGMVWGGLHKLALGVARDTGATVVSAGRRARYGSWIDVRMDGENRVVRMTSREIYPVQGEDYSCGLSRVQAGDTLRLTGKDSWLGFAVERMSPANARLMEVCAK